MTTSCDFLLEIYSFSRDIPTADTEKVLSTLTATWFIRDHLQSKISIVQRRTSAMRNILVWLGRLQCLTSDKTRKATSTDTPASAERKRRSFVAITLRQSQILTKRLLMCFRSNSFLIFLGRKIFWRRTNERKDDQISEENEQMIFLIQHLRPTKDLVITVWGWLRGDVKGSVFV